MATGTVKWFSEEKGYGFIVPDSAGPDIFVHASALSRDESVAEKDRVTYEVGNNKGRTCATNVKVMA